MAEYDNMPTQWYRAEGASLTAIRALVGNTVSAKDKIAHLKTLGVIDHLAVQVQAGGPTYPRAYETAATLWADPVKQDVFYIECPIDYTGTHYAPPDAVALDDAQTRRVQGSLFMGGWGDSIPLTANFKPRRGTALPADFDEAVSKTLEGGGYFRSASFADRAIFRATDDTAWTLRRRASMAKGSHHVSGHVTLDANDWPAALKDKSGKPPVLWVLPEGIYLEYADKNNAPVPGADMVAVDPAEYVWVRMNHDDRELGLYVPEPPAALDDLYMKDMFEARGLSHLILKRDYNAQAAMYKRLRAFEDRVFGKPDPRTVFNVAGSEIRSYGAQPQAEWLDNGEFKGFRFDWEPLNKPGRGGSAIRAYPVPANWAEVPGHPGVYLPDPALLPADAAACATFNFPPLQRDPAICGKPPAIVIRNKTSRFPRADKQWPTIHTDDDRYYIHVPVDYKGNIHRPDNAARLPKQQWYDFRDSCGDRYEGDWIMPKAVPVPADFKPEKGAKPDRDYYLLTGPALAAWQRFEAMRKTVEEARAAYMKTLGDFSSYGYYGPELTCVDFKTPPGPGWIPAPGRGANSFKPDPATPEGLKIMQDFAALPKHPDYTDLHAMLPTGTRRKIAPHVQLLAKRGDLVIVSYPANTLSVPHPSMRPVDADIFGWLHEEEMDYRSDRPTAPIPAEIEAFLEDCKKHLNGPKPPAPPKPSGPS